MTVDNPSVARRVEEERKRLYNAFDRLDRGEDVDLEEFRGVLGVVHAPIAWEQLKRALQIGSEEAMGTLGRTVLQIKSYYQHRDNVILKQFASVTDYLLHQVFGAELKLGEDGRKVASLPNDFDSRLHVVWRDNDFPYFFEDGVEHHNIWANRPLSEEELEKVISENRVGYESVWYINPPPLMSVPTIWHAHVISRLTRAPRTG